MQGMFLLFICSCFPFLFFPFPFFDKCFFFSPLFIPLMMQTWHAPLTVKHSAYHVSNITSSAREWANPAVPSNGWSVPREDAVAPGDDPDGQTQPAEPRKQAPSDHLTIIIISLSHCQLHVAGTSERSYYSALLGFTRSLIV